LEGSLFLTGLGSGRILPHPLPHKFPPNRPLDLLYAGRYICAFYLFHPVYSQFTLQSSHFKLQLTAGKEVCPEIAKTSLIELSFASSIAKLYGFVGFRVVPEVFSGRTDPKVWFGCIARNLMHYSGLRRNGKVAYTKKVAYFISILIFGRRRKTAGVNESYRVAFKKVSSDILQERGELRPPTPPRRCAAHNLDAPRGGPRSCGGLPPPSAWRSLEIEGKLSPAQFGVIRRSLNATWVRQAKPGRSGGGVYL
jgi:hypothetical protein